MLFIFAQFHFPLHDCSLESAFNFVIANPDFWCSHLTCFKKNDRFSSFAVFVVVVQLYVLSTS